MTTRSMTRVALAVGLCALAGVLIWVGMARASSGQTGTVPLLLFALVPLAAAGLLFIRRGFGAALAVIAALLAAGVGIGLSMFAPLSTESIAILVAALGVFVLALVELLAVGLAWVGVAILVAVFVLLFSSNPPILVAGLVVIGVVAWLALRRRGSRSDT